MYTICSLLPETCDEKQHTPFNCIQSLQNFPGVRDKKTEIAINYLARALGAAEQQMQTLDSTLSNTEGFYYTLWLTLEYQCQYAHISRKQKLCSSYDGALTLHVSEASSATHLFLQHQLPNDRKENITFGGVLEKLMLYKRSRLYIQKNEPFIYLFIFSLGQLHGINYASVLLCSLCNFQD